jgi:NAD(P)-dependent dehydrogenase (short-subunit alcohol dehydrogenase family)
LARAGHLVVAVSRSGTLPPLPPAQTFRSTHLFARHLDIRNPQAISTTLTDLVDEFGRLDAVVNSAGIAVAGSLEDTPAEMLEAQLQTNLVGAAHLFRAAIPHLRRFAPSRLVHISSLAAHVALPYQSLYSAAHFGMSGLCQSLRYELAPHGVRVILVEPGSVRTGLTAHRATAAPSRPYLADATKVLAVNDEDERKGVEPDKIAIELERLLTMKNPPDRLPVGHLEERLSLTAKRFLPGGIFRRIISSHYD